MTLITVYFQVLDGDNVFLAAQDLELERQGREQAARNFFTPASLDHGVRGIRNWLADCAGQLPWGPDAISRSAGGGLTRRQMLDRFESHTQHCPSCAGVRLL